MDFTRTMTYLGYAGLALVVVTRLYGWHKSGKLALWRTKAVSVTRATRKRMKALAAKL